MFWRKCNKKTMEQRKKRTRLNAFQMIILGFLCVILLGSLLLMLPISTKDRQGAGFLDALFTATSATCVTGLIVRDTASYWSTFGQCVILLLIQVGGMGVVTIAVSFAMVAGRKISLFQRSTMQEAISAPQVGGILRMTGFILRISLCIELLGAVLLSYPFCREFGAARGLYYAIFHSISAFCNAGFDLMGIKEPFSSLTSFAAQPLVNFTIMALIIVGGIGFLTWDDVRTHKLRLRRYRMQTKVALTVSAVLILVPALGYFFFEFHTQPLGTRLLYSLFQAVTPRTAGFNTVNLSAMREAGIAVMILLMLIGGSPGSTAGGMKTTTVGVLFAACASIFRRQDSAHLFRRRVDDATVKHAAAILLLYLSLFLSCGLVISLLEGLPLLTCLFETASAVGTVGLTLGVTPQLGLISHLLLIALMFLGRVGGLTLIYAALSSRPAGLSKYPVERITVG